jgi:flagellar biosynthetic protein FliQ
MEVSDAIDIGREAIVVILTIGSPILLAGMVVGLLIGLAQALTQIQEQTIAFVPKIVSMIIALSFSLPWLITRMVEYSRELILNIPNTLGPH